jgi:hypothetical protein
MNRGRAGKGGKVTVFQSRHAAFALAGEANQRGQNRPRISRLGMGGNGDFASLRGAVGAPAGVGHVPLQLKVQAIAVSGED